MHPSPISGLPQGTQTKMWRFQIAVPSLQGLPFSILAPVIFVLVASLPGGGERQCYAELENGKTIARDLPRPLASHPGNVFLEGEEIVIPLPPEVSERTAGEDPKDLEPSSVVKETATHWRVLDDRLEQVRAGTLARNELGISPPRLGSLGVGWYRAEFLNAQAAVVGWTTLAVLAPLQTPVPMDSPVCLDGALSWYPTESQGIRVQLASLAALAGANWIRDRLRWREIEAEPGTFVYRTKYDDMAEAQNGLGLKVLQVFHLVPPWAAENENATGRFPPDLRHLYRFCREMAKRFEGKVQAWEPWNEANASNFGGHTTDEMCSLQKAGYLGFKAGNPDVEVCWNPIGGINTKDQATGILENETWPYYDVYSIHSYDWSHAYADLWAPAREAAAGRPIWVTECDRGMRAEEGSPWGDYSHEDAVLKAQFMAQSYAQSLFSGSSRHYHFILGHYMETHAHPIQFGLLRKDLTPRPSYVALAALGRFLAGGKCLGRWEIENQPDAYVYAFRSRPDGEEKDVWVAWAEKSVDWPQRGKAVIDWTLPEDLVVDAVYDYLGRQLTEFPKQLRSAPVFIVLPAGQSGGAPLTPPLNSGPMRPGEASKVVFQLRTPNLETIKKQVAWTQEHERTMKPGSETEMMVNVYNFGEEPAKGEVVTERIPQGWGLLPASVEIQLEPMECKELWFKMKSPRPDDESAEDTWFRIRGHFEEAGDPVLAFRVLSEN